MKIYISMPTSEVAPEARRQMLLRAITEVEASGHKAVYPSSRNAYDIGERINLMLKSDAIYLLPKWYENRVCCSEKQVAENYNKKILFTIPEKR